VCECWGLAMGFGRAHHLDCWPQDFQGDMKQTSWILVFLSWGGTYFLSFGIKPPATLRSRPRGATAHGIGIRDVCISYNTRFIARCSRVEAHSSRESKQTRLTSLLILGCHRVFGALVRACESAVRAGPPGRRQQCRPWRRPLAIRDTRPRRGGTRGVTDGGASSLKRPSVVGLSSQNA
jgi:hypothetical protein